MIYLASIAPARYFGTDGDGLVYDWRDFAKRIEAASPTEAGEKFVASAGGTPGRLRALETWDGAQVFQYGSDARSRLLVAIDTPRTLRQRAAVTLRKLAIYLESK